jgi:glutamate carboxypeptidase
MLNFKPEQIRSLVRDKLPKGLNLLRTLCAINSFTTNREGVHKVQSILENEFWSLGLKTSRTLSPKRADILVAETNATGSQILLVGHSDTVHLPTSSFQKCKDLENNKITGPGVLDMKGGLVHILIILEILKDLNLLQTIPLKIIVNSAEENSTPTSAILMKDIAKGAKSALVFEIGRKEGGIVTERKGILEFSIISKGKASHSGNAFTEGINAIIPLCEIALELQNLIDIENGVTVNVAQIKGGEHFCVVPEYAALGVEIRTCKESQSQEALCKINELILRYGDKLELLIETETAPLNKVPETDVMFKNFQEIAKDFGFICKELPRVGGLSDANLIGSLGIPTLDALGPYGEGAHTDWEYIEVDSMEPRISAVLGWLLKEI